MDAAFAIAAPLRHRTLTSSSSSTSLSSHIRCTYAPQKSVVTKSPQPKSSPTRPTAYRVLPVDLPKEDRPPSPPHHWSIPVIGYFVERAIGIYSTHFSKREQFGSIHTSDYLISSRVYLSDYDAITDVLHDTEIFRSKGALPPLSSVFGEDALLNLDGMDHSIARTALLPAFSPKLFPFYFKRVLERVEKTWEFIYNSTKRGDVVRLSPVFNKLYLAMTIEMTTGVDLNGEQAQRIPDLFNDVQRLFFSPSFLPMYNTGLRAREQLMKILEGVVRDKLKNQAKTIEKLRKYGDDVMKMGLSSGDVDILLVSIANSNLSTNPNATIDENVVNALSRSMLLLWFAGYSTAAAASSCASFELGFNSELWKKLEDEQRGIMKDRDDMTVKYDETGKMILLDSFLMEILRMYPPAAGMNRKVACDVELMGRFVPKDSTVFCDFAAAHRDPNIYSEPNTLIPERFMKSGGGERVKAAGVLSFGPRGSPHYCIGASFSKILMKTTFATLLRRYEYELDEKQSRKYQIIPDVVPQSGVRVKSLERKEL